MEIGHRIKKARESAGLTQTALAKACGVSRGLVGQWESHIKKPGRDNITKIAEATSVSVGFLLGTEEFDQSTLTIVDPEETSLVRRYRTLSARQKRSVRELIGAAAEFPFPEEETHEAAD